jgi:putative DNA primase/helicase
LDPSHIGAETEAFETVPCLRLDAQAEGAFLEWRQDLEDCLRSESLSPALESHFTKYRKLVPSLALINHLADDGRGVITKEPMLKAIGMSYYLETHAKRAYASGPEAETAAARAIVDRVHKGQLQDRFTARDIHQQGLVAPDR